MLEIADEAAYIAYEGMNLKSVMKWGHNEWKCITNNDYYLNIRIKAGLVHFDLAETECQLGQAEGIVLKAKTRSLKDYFKAGVKIDFDEIKDFMKFTCHSDEIWDI